MRKYPLLCCYHCFMRSGLWGERMCMHWVLEEAGAELESLSHYKTCKLWAQQESGASARLSFFKSPVVAENAGC
eukprot:770794-Pelagomonas_calceolata.AAC.2